MISQYNCVEYCQCNGFIRLRTKSGERHSGYILNPKHDIKHRYIRQINSFCFRTDAGQVRNYHLIEKNQMSSFFQPISHPFADIGATSGISRSPF